MAIISVFRHNSTDDPYVRVLPGLAKSYGEFWDSEVNVINYILKWPCVNQALRRHIPHDQMMNAFDYTAGFKVVRGAIIEKQFASLAGQVFTAAETDEISSYLFGAPSRAALIDNMPTFVRKTIMLAASIAQVKRLPTKPKRAFIYDDLHRFLPTSLQFKVADLMINEGLAERAVVPEGTYADWY